MDHDQRPDATRVEMGDDGREYPRPRQAVESFCLSAAVLVAAENYYDRLRRIHAAANAHLTASGAPVRLPQSFNDFLDQMIVRGLCALAPVTLEMQRSLGLVETMAADDLRLIRSVLAGELTQLADGLAAIGDAHPDRALGNSCLGAIRDAAAIMRIAAEM